MRPRRILVSGAGGFLGCRLVERLVLGEGIPVRAMAHRPGGAVRLARLPVEIVWADIADAADVERAIAGCDVVVHCAYGTAGGRTTRRQITVDGTRLLAEAALAGGVQRFVHVSTIVVYSYSPPGQVDERTPFVRSGDTYCDDKIDAEESIWRLIRQRNLPATVLRMGHIYGPFSAPWTVTPLSHIRDDYVTLVDGGHHASNAVFVDNAVEAILRAIREEAAVGEAFFVTDDQVSWRTWYEHYAAWLGGTPLHSASSPELAAMLRPSLLEKARAVGQDTWSSIVLPSAAFAWQRVLKTDSLWPLVDAIRLRTPRAVRSRVKQRLFRSSTAGTDPADYPPRDERRFPPAGLLEIYAGRTAFANDKAKQLLGFGPMASFDQAMRTTERWARWARLV
ncbi:MAG: NAD-dependent epimerase/dehydratase family protein [Chloroflexi bacterium]|nr:NAD-dependent epimerase/dehydratase family protein [Chloroflexota bacterium]